MHLLLHLIFLFCIVNISWSLDNYNATDTAILTTLIEDELATTSLLSNSTQKEILSQNNETSQMDHSTEVPVSKKPLDFNTTEPLAISKTPFTSEVFTSASSSLPSTDSSEATSSIPPDKNLTSISSTVTESILNVLFPTSSGEDNPTDAIEQNAILTTERQEADKDVRIVVGRKCSRIFQDSILWNDTDGGVLALKSCPPNYDGNMYRPCFSSGKWGSVDYTECRLKHLGRMRHVIVHQAEKGMLENMYRFVEEFSNYISSVDMKSPMDRLEAFEILNTFLKLDMNLKMDKPRDTKYIVTLLHACNELIKKKTVMFTSGSLENNLITEKAVEMVSYLTLFAERSLYGLLRTHKKHIAFRSSPNVLVYLYRGKLSGQVTLMNITSEKERDDEMSSYFNIEETLKRSAYALIWIKGLNRLLSTGHLIVNSDVAVTTILSPLNSLNHMSHPPTFDTSLKMDKPVPDGYTAECGHFWNISSLWNLKDCVKLNVKGLIVTCRCQHLGSTAVLLQKRLDDSSLEHSSPIGKMISVSCVISISATVLTLVVNFLLKRGDQNLSVFILINLIVCLISIQLLFLYGVNKTDRIEFCLSFAMLLHYMFVVLCCWVVAYGVNLLWRLRSNMEYTGRPRDFCIVCWVVPGLLLIIAFIINPKGYETNLYCWMNLQRDILWSFVLPVTGFILMNTGVMILALKTFNKQMSLIHRIDICKIRNSLRAGITLLPFFAVNWFFGILAIEKSYDTMLQATFALTNAMQGILTFVFFCILDTNIQTAFRMKVSEVSRKPKICSMKLKKSGSFPILERSLITLSEDRRRLDCTPLLAGKTAYHDAPEDPCCSNIRV